MGNSMPRTGTMTIWLSDPFLDLDEGHEELYSPDMPSMTLDEFQAWSDQVIRDATSPGPDVDTTECADDSKDIE